ncbi:MAG TPA: Gldg family protein, partial [Chitinophagaceae bacterium]|nr:Gldg family protein [Chitinophagaceae bacterium]
MPVSKKNKNTIGWWIVVIAAMVAINFFASSVHERLDLTNEKRFTISYPVKKLLGDLNDNVDVNIFLKGDLPAGFKNLAVSSEELLQEFKEYSHGRIHYKLISPDDAMPGTGRTWGDTLSSLGFVPINLKVQLKAGEQSQYVYPAALATYNSKMIPVNLYSGTETVITPSELNSSEALLEYKFADAINKLIEKQKPMIAYSVGNGEPAGNDVFDLVTNVLQKNYTLFTLNISKQPVIPDTFRLLMIVKPTVPFTEDEKMKIDQYVMHGGKVLWFIDRLEAEMDSLQIKNQVIAYDRGLNLDDLLFKYGVRINPDLVMDLQSDFLPFDVNSNKQFDFLHWNYFPLFESKQNSVINKNIGLVAGRFVNSLDTVNAPAIKKTILLSSSDNSRTISTPALISGAENRNAPEDDAFKMKNIPAGVLLEGKFTSLYKNRV